MTLLRGAQLMRYEKQIDLKGFDIIKQQELQDSKVAVIGAGGLGCPVSLYLCASGVGSITIVDNDDVHLSNLQRQILYKTNDQKLSKAILSKKYLSELNDGCTIRAIPERATEENIETIIKDMDVIVDSTDNFKTRYLINRACLKYKKPLISGAVIFYSGQLSVFRGYEEKLPCYQCLYPSQPESHEAPQCTESAVLAPVVGVIGTMMAVECIKELLTLGDSNANILSLYNGLTGQTSRIDIKKKSSCKACGSH